MDHLLASMPNELLAMDFNILEKASDGRENVLVITDVFSKFKVAVPTTDQTASTTVKVLVREWFMKYGIPESLHSDQGWNLEGRIDPEKNVYEIRRKDNPEDVRIVKRVHLRVKTIQMKDSKGKVDEYNIANGLKRGKELTTVVHKSDTSDSSDSSSDEELYYRRVNPSVPTTTGSLLRTAGRHGDIHHLLRSVLQHT